MTFTFVEPERCARCGSYKKDECDHTHENDYLFRHVVDKEIVEINAVGEHRWQVLKDCVGEEWLLYEYIGTKESVEYEINNMHMGGIEDIPHIDTPENAPEYVFSEQQ